MSDRERPDQSAHPDFEPPSSAVSTGEDEGQNGLGAQRPASVPRRQNLVRVMIVVGLVVAIVAVAKVVEHRAAQPGTSARPTPTALTHPLPTAGPRPSDPLLQQVWNARDDIYPMDLAGFTFSFRAPGSWGCLRSGRAGIRWICMDETGLLGGTGPADPSSGIVQSDECSAPCAAKAYANVLQRLAALGVDTSGLHTVDARTRVDDRPDPTVPGARLYRMSRIYDSDGDGTLDRHLWVSIAVSDGDEVPAQKMLGDLYDATR